MSNDEKNLDERLKRAMGSAPIPEPDASVLDQEALSQRTPKARNPRTTKRVASGSLMGVASLAVVGVVVSTLGIPTQDPLFALAASAGLGTSEMAASDSRIGLWVEYDYSAGEELSRDGGSGPVYQLLLQGDPESVLSSVAAEFGLEGEPRQSQYFDPAYPSYDLGSADWTGPSLSVTWSGTGAWYYSNPAAYPEPVCSEVPAPEGFEEPYYECENPIPTGVVPSEDEARAKAAAIFQATGLSVTAEDVRVLNRDEWSVGVSAALVVDGVETALEWSLYFAPGAVLASATGHSVSVVEQGSFDTISPVDAVDRLASGMWWGSPGPGFYSYDLMAADARALEEMPMEDGTEVITPEGEETPGNEGEEPPLEPDVPLEPEMPAELEVVSLVVTSAEATLLVAWDAAGNAWLVPGYVMRYSDEAWGWTSVISLVPGVIEVPEPLPIDTMPLPEPFIEE
jgi:hypothetical protein